MADSGFGPARHAGFYGCNDLGIGSLRRPANLLLHCGVYRVPGAMQRVTLLRRSTVLPVKGVD